VEQRLQWLVADLADAVASRSRAPDHEHMRVLLELLADEHGQARRPAPLDPEVLGDEADDELADLASLVGLSSLDASLLVVAAVADLDVRFGALFGFLEGVPVQSRATVALALELCGHGSMSPSPSAPVPGADRSRRSVARGCCASATTRPRSSLATSSCRIAWSPTCLATARSTPQGSRT